MSGTSSGREVPAVVVHAVLLEVEVLLGQVARRLVDLAGVDAHRGRRTDHREPVVRGLPRVAAALPVVARRRAAGVGQEVDRRGGHEVFLRPHPLERLGADTALLQAPEVALLGDPRELARQASPRRARPASAAWSAGSRRSRSRSPRRACPARTSPSRPRRTRSRAGRPSTGSYFTSGGLSGCSGQVVAHLRGEVGVDADRRPARTCGRAAGRPAHPSRRPRWRTCSYPSTSFIRVFSRSAVCHQFQPVSVSGDENPYPGREISTTSKESAGSPPYAAGSVSGPITLRRSQNVHGQPWWMQQRHRVRTLALDMDEVQRHAHQVDLEVAAARSSGARRRASRTP